MYELVIKHNDEEKPVYCAEDKRMIELRRQRHARSLAAGEVYIREFVNPKKAK
ncbi:MAG: hypothetical protein OCC46_00065 [Pseudodesulfovibrio sp.]